MFMMGWVGVAWVMGLCHVRCRETSRSVVAVVVVFVVYGYESVTCTHM